MNYRHAYHAGNFADVIKHLVVVLVIEHLKQKPTAFRIIDTHAGAGIYDLDSIEAQKTSEWKDGIGRLIDADLPEDVRRILAPYLAILQVDHGTDGRLVRYPGSPLLARRLMRPGDVLIANELHPEDRQHLLQLFRRDAQVKVMALDGYVALKSLLPPKERRGLVLIDPPFEEAGEFDRLADAVTAAHERFATGTLVLWYPIKDRPAVARFHQRLAASCRATAFALELSVGEVAATAGPSQAKGLPIKATSGKALGRGLAATGLVVVNPPYRLAENLLVAMPVLAGLMALGPGGGARLSWLVSEASHA